MILETLSQCSFVSDSICATATEVLTHIISNFLTFVASAGIAFIVYILYTKSGTIRRKTKAETKQKLELDSIINVIDGTDDIQLAINEMGLLMLHIIKDMFEQIEKQDYLDIHDIVTEARDKFFKDSNIAQEKIYKFSFLLKKEFVINKEMSGEHKVIEKEFNEIKAINENMINAIHKVKESEITKQNAHGIKQELITLIDAENAKVDEFAINIIGIYKIKLDKG